MYTDHRQKTVQQLFGEKGGVVVAIYAHLPGEENNDWGEKGETQNKTRHTDKRQQRQRHKTREREQNKTKATEAQTKDRI